jgi:hypothetical protein
MRDLHHSDAEIIQRFIITQRQLDYTIQAARPTPRKHTGRHCKLKDPQIDILIAYSQPNRDCMEPHERLDRKELSGKDDLRSITQGSLRCVEYNIVRRLVKPRCDNARPYGGRYSG